MLGWKDIFYFQNYKKKMLLFFPAVDVIALVTDVPPSVPLRPPPLEFHQFWSIFNQIFIIGYPKHFQQYVKKKKIGHKMTS